MYIKTICICLALIASVNMSSQDFKERHIIKLENLGIEYKTEYSFSQEATKDLHQLLHYDFKRSAKNTVAASLLTVGVGGLVGGTLILTNKNSYSSGLTQFAGGLVFAIGAAGAGTSIPLFVSARTSRKNRDLLKMKYMDDLIDNASLQQTELLNSSENQNLFKE